MADPAFDPAQSFDVQPTAHLPKFDQSQPFSVSQETSKGSGIGKNIAAGFGEGLTSLPGMVVNAINPVPGIKRTIASITGAPYAPEQQLQDMTGAGNAVTHAINKGLGLVGLNPEDVVAATPGERIARFAGTGATALLAPEAAGLKLAESLGAEGIAQVAPKLAQKVVSRAANAPIATTVKKAATGAGSGLGAGAAVEAVPDDHPILKTIAGLVGGIGGGLAAEAPGMVASGARTAGKVLDRWAAPMTVKGRDQAAAEIIRGRASNPGEFEVALHDGADEIVPGSKPTTFQQTGDMGIGSLEREVATKNPDLFNARRADQAVARSAALQAIDPAGDPKEVAGYFRQQLDNIDAATEAAVSAAKAKGEGAVAAVDVTTGKALEDATAAAQQHGAQVGGTGTPETYGAAIRSAVTDAESAAKTRTSRLYDAIDPDGKLTGNVATTRQAARDIMGEMSPTSMPMSGTETDIFEKASSLPQLAPARDLIELNKYVNASMKAEMRANGATPSYARLSRLRSAIQNNIDNTISDRVASEAEAVKNGHLQPDDTLSARLKAEADEWKSQRAETGRAVGDDTVQSSGTGPAAISGEVGAESAPEQRLGDVTGSESVSEQPTFDDDAAARLAEASKSHAQRKQTFGISPVSDITKSSGMNGQYKLPNSAVPAKVFYPKPTSFQSVQATLKANPEALPIIEDYAAMSMRRAAMNEDGTIDPAKFNRWAAAHQDALRALPETTRARFSSAAEAGNTLAEAMTGRAAALKEAQAQALQEVAAATAARKAKIKDVADSVVGKFGKLSEPEDITKAVGTILGGKTAVADMKELAQAVENNPAAKAGLRQAVADHISKRFISNTEAGTTETNQIRSDQFQTFMRNNRAALATILSPGEMDTLHRIAADLQRSNRSITATALPGRSNTPQDLYGVGKNSNQSLFGRILSEAAAAGAGGAGFTVGGPWGAALGWLGTKAVNGARSAGLEKLDDLIASAILNPDLASDLLKRAPVKPDNAQATSFATRLRRIGQGTAAAQLAPQNGYAEGGRVESAQNKKIDKAAGAAAPEPTDLQKQTGNYAKGHIRLHGLDVTIETPRGSERTGNGANGEKWSSKNTLAHYGYIKRTTGADSEHIDVYVGPNSQSGKVFVIDQHDPKDKSFDENKVIFGAKDARQAQSIYDAGFSDKSGPWRRGHVREMSVPDFKAWLKSGETTKPTAPD